MNSILRSRLTKGVLSGVLIIIPLIAIAQMGEGDRGGGGMTGEGMMGGDGMGMHEMRGMHGMGTDGSMMEMGPMMGHKSGKSRERKGHEDDPEMEDDGSPKGEGPHSR